MKSKYRILIIDDDELIAAMLTRALKTADGTPLLVPAGKVWISIVPDVGTVTWG
jgi:DNA-binding response OmpR family regulator